MPSEDEDEEPVEISKRKQRKLARLSVAELKRLVRKPEVVDWVDVSATDPKLLVQIKSHRNTIPIPPHWSQKRDYLQGKRGIEKPAFQLPSQFIGAHFSTFANHLATQVSSPIPVSLPNETPSRRRRKVNRSNPRRGNGSNRKWARSISIIRNCTMRSSSIKPSPR